MNYHFLSLLESILNIVQAFKLYISFIESIKKSEKNRSAILLSKHALKRIIQSKSYYLRNLLKEG